MVITATEFTWSYHATLYWLASWWHCKRHKCIAKFDQGSDRDTAQQIKQTCHRNVQVNLRIISKTLSILVVSYIVILYMFKNLSLFYSDGCSRTGTFITICYALDRLNIEGTVDIFHAIKSARICRAGLVENVVSILHLYHVCYHKAFTYNLLSIYL